MKRVSEKKTSARKAANAIWMVLAGASAGAALNNLLALTALKEISRGFQEANSNFFAGGIFFELLGACLKFSSQTPVSCVPKTPWVPFGLSCNTGQ